MSSHLDLMPYHDLANNSWSLTAGVLQRLHGQIPNSPPTTNQLALFNPPGSRSPLLQMSRSQNICRNAKQYRENTRRLDQLANPVPGTNSQEWTCSKCSTHVGKVSSKLPGTTPDVLWIGAEGLFKSHCDDGWWSCIWRIVDHSCRGQLFGTQLELLQHMKDHHVIASSNIESFRLHLPADLRNDCIGIGAVVCGREMQWHNFVN
jgi:hypothetical protein